MESNPDIITPVQLLLIQAALDEPGQALRCFTEWWKSVDIDHTGSTEYRLMPLVYQNIGRLITDEAAAARVKGVAKHVWLSNHRSAALGALVIDRLNAKRLSAMIIKGVAMMTAVYGEDMRATEDCDILVSVNDAPQALLALIELGYKPLYQDALNFSPADFKLVHGLTLIGGADQQNSFDLHWRPLPDVTGVDLTSEFFDYSVPCVFSGRPTHRPCFEHLLLHAAVHGTEWSSVRRYDWLADATLILRRAGAAFDWDRLAETADRYRLAWIIYAALDELARTLNVPVPASALRRPRRGDIIERIEARLRSKERLPPLGRPIMALQRFRRQKVRSARDPLRTILRDIWRRLFGPPPRALMRSSMTRYDEDHVIFLSGWSYAEFSGRWTNGPLATLAIQRAPQRSSDSLRIAGFTIQASSEMPQVIDVYSGWRHLGRLTWSSEAWKHDAFVIPLPPALQAREMLMLQLHLRRPVAPADIGLSTDMRRLGLFLKDIRISPIDFDTTTSPIEFHNGSGNTAILWTGWLLPEHEGCWTEGSDAVLRWTSPRDLPSDGNLIIRILSFAAGDDPIRGTISINTHVVGDLSKLNQLPVPIDLEVPLCVSPGVRDICVHIHICNVAAKGERSSASDGNKCRLLVQSIRIETGGRISTDVLRNDGP